MTMSTNVQCIEPNLAMILENHQLKLFNLIYGARSPAGFTNTLLWRDMSGQVIFSWPTDIELQSQINSLDYDGVYFWSVQDQNDTPHYPGWVVRKWVMNTTSFSLGVELPFRTVMGPHRANAIAVEYYRFRLLSDMGTDRNWIWIDTARYGYVMPRLLAGQKVRIGPNALGDYFWGTIRRLTTSTPYSIIEFDEYPEASFVGEQPLFSGADNGTECCIEARIYVFDDGGTLHVLNPIDLATIEEHQDPLYRNVTAADFCIVKNVSAIQVGMRTLGLFFVNNLVVYCADVARSLTPSVYHEEKLVYDEGAGTWAAAVVNSITDRNVVSAQSLPLNFVTTNEFIPVQEIRIRHDDPEDPDSHPQAYLLQKDYRESYTATPGTWAAYNLVTPLQKLDAQSTFVALNVWPLTVASGETADCRVMVLDDYRRRVSGEKVNWSVTAAAGQLLDPLEAYTDINGVSSNRFKAANLITFPAYITATVSGAM
jgi:hypothetical protein